MVVGGCKLQKGAGILISGAIHTRRVARGSSDTWGHRSRGIEESVEEDAGLSCVSRGPRGDGVGWERIDACPT